MSVADEIDLIIARAMAEYQDRHPENVVESDVSTVAASSATTSFADSVASSATQAAEVPVWDATQTESTPNIIPENSESLLISQETSRFSSAVWYEEIQRRDVVLAGLGGIGSYVAFLLSRLDIQNLYLFDPDTVEVGNLSGQLYDDRSIGENKAVATYSLLTKFSHFYKVNAFSENYSSAVTSDIMMCGFDNMEARKQFFLAWKGRVALSPNPSKCLFIDGRLAAENLQVLCIKGDDSYSMEKYEREFLFSDEEAEETICSYKQTTFMANMIGSIMVNLFVNFVANEYCEELIKRDLPFLTEYSASSMYFKVVA